MKGKYFNKIMAFAVAAAMVAGNAPLAAYAADGSVGMKSVTIGGISYYYANTAGQDDSTTYAFTIKGRHGAADKDYSYKKSDLTRVGNTDYYYVVPSGTALSGTLYTYNNDGKAATYKSVYKDEAGIDVDSSYDAVSSATKFTSRHAGDIPSLVTIGKDASGDSAITGLSLGRTAKSIGSADAYVEANILKAAGEKITSDQETLAATELKQNPNADKSKSDIAVKVKDATYTDDSEYGLAEFDIVPDDTVKGYVWSEYWDNVYGATISDGNTTVPVVHWIDMYGEKATSGYHYNKLQIALNNGTSKAKNQAKVTRYADFFNAENKLDPGTYTITVYADGYSDLVATVNVPGTSTGNHSITAVTSKITSAKANKTEQSSNFSELKARSTSQSKKSVTVKWSKVSGAASYTVFGAKSGSTYKALTTTTKTSYKNTGLKKGKYYQYIVVAADSQGKVIATSKIVNAATKGGKYTNYKSVKLKSKSKVKVKVGKTSKIKASAVKAKKSKKVTSKRKLKYESSDVTVATVSSKGKIKGVKKGTATIYVYTQSGTYKTVKVTVK